MIHVETVTVGEDVEEISEVLEDSEDYVGMYFTGNDENTELTYATKVFINNYYDAHKLSINPQFASELQDKHNWNDAYEPLILPLVRLFDNLGSYSLELARYIEVLYITDEYRSSLESNELTE